MIEFEALENSTTARVSAAIVDGAYSIPPTTRLVPGKYVVRVYQSSKPAAATGPPGSDEATPVIDLVSEKYNVNSQLQVEITDVTPHIFDFQVERSQ
jgi:hypothetical protein